MKTSYARKLLLKNRQNRRQAQVLKETLAKRFPNMHKNYSEHSPLNIGDMDCPLLLDASVPYEPFEKEYLRTCKDPATQQFLLFQIFARYQRKKLLNT